MDFGKRIQYVISNSFLDQKVISKKSGITVKTIIEWKSRTTPPKRKSNVNKLADTLNCSFEWLWTGEGEPYPNNTPPSGNAVDFNLGKKDPLTNLNPKLQRLAKWIELQDDDLDYWAAIEAKFAQDYPDYKKWLKEQNLEKKENTGTDN